MSKKNKILYCPACGKENTPDAVLCKECGQPIEQEEHLFKDFLISHIKDDLKEKLSGKLFDVIKGWLLSHLYSSVVTVTIVAVAATGAAAVANHVQSNNVSGRPASIAELSLLSPAEQSLFEENNSHSIFDPENYEEVWRPAVLEHTLLTKKNSCYGWVVVRDMELDAEKLFDGYSEIYVCPGITVTVNGNPKEKQSFTDFYVAKGGTLIINGDVKGGANICNDGTTVINGNYDGGSSLLSCNRGTFTVTGVYSGALNLFSFRGATVNGTDHTDTGILYYDIDASDLYEGVTGINGMFVAVGSLK